MLTSSKSRHVFWCPPGMLLQDQTAVGGWYFWDEVGGLGGGPYLTEKAAIDGLDAYVRQLNAPELWEEYE